MVLSGVQRNGLRDTDTLVLEIEDAQGNVLSTWQGKALANLARQTFPPAQVT